MALGDLGYVEMEPNTAYVVRDECSGCKTCLTLCPFSAISQVEGKSEINPVLCKGCGTCVAACPAQAISGAHFSNDQILAEIDGVLKSDSSWQVMSDPSHRRDAPLYTKQIGFSEHRDMRAERMGWKRGQDGDQGWSEAAEIASAMELGGRALCPRPIPPLSYPRGSWETTLLRR